MKTKEEIVKEINRLKNKEAANKTFLQYGDDDCKMKI